MTEKALKPIKPFLNYEEQINNLIEQKGMIVNDHKFAVSKLEDISYFALIDGYKNLFYNPMTRKYKEGTTFEDLVALYEFDEKLRTLIFRYLCHFEQKMRSLISYHFCDTYSEKQEDYLNAVHYNNSGANKKKIAALIAILDREAKKSTDHAYVVYQTVRENIMMPLILNEDDPVESSKTAETMAEKLGIYKLLDKKPYELSGGEKQRTAICRAMAENPELILADEPTGNLDSNSSKQVIHTLSYINQEFGKTIVMVTHDPQMASYCSRLILLKDGVILEDLKNSGNQEVFYQEILGKMKEL